MNAIPGTDPAEGALYNGDWPADIMDAALRDIDLAYWLSWGRPAKPEELRAVWDFCSRPTLEGTWELNGWFPVFLDWIGLPHHRVRLSTETLDAISRLFQYRLNKPHGNPSYAKEWEEALTALEGAKKEILRLCDGNNPEQEKELQAWIRAVASGIIERNFVPYQVRMAMTVANKFLQRQAGRSNPQYHFIGDCTGLDGDSINK